MRLTRIIVQRSRGWQKSQKLCDNFVKGGSGGGTEKWSREGERSIKIEAFRIEKNCFRLNDKKNLGNKENRMFFLVHSIPDVRMICKSIFLHILEVPPRKRASFAI